MPCVALPCHFVSFRAIASAQLRNAIPLLRRAGRVRAYPLPFTPVDAIPCPCLAAPVVAFPCPCCAAQRSPVHLPFDRCLPCRRGPAPCIAAPCRRVSPRSCAVLSRRLSLRGRAFPCHRCPKPCRRFPWRTRSMPQPARANLFRGRATRFPRAWHQRPAAAVRVLAFRCLAAAVRRTSIPSQGLSLLPAAFLFHRAGFWRFSWLSHASADLSFSSPLRSFPSHSEAMPPHSIAELCNALAHLIHPPPFRRQAWLTLHSIASSLQCTALLRRSVAWLCYALPLPIVPSFRRRPPRVSVLIRRFAARAARSVSPARPCRSAPFRR